MKQLVHFLIAITLLSVPLWPQALPDAPSPAVPDPAWDRLKNLAIGTPIVVRDVDEVSVQCLFTGVTDAYLFCNPAGNPPGVGYRFDRNRVLSVDFDRPAQNDMYSYQPQSNWHPGVLAAAVIVGTAIGIAVSRNTNAQGAAAAGLLSAGVVGGIGYEIAEDQDQRARFGVRVPVSRSMARRAATLPHRMPFLRAR